MTQHTSFAAEEQTITQTAAEFKNYFLSNNTESVKSYRKMVAQVAESIATQISGQQQPYSGKSPQELQEDVAAIDFFPEHGISMDEVLQKTHALVMENNISTYHPLCMAHLHCPTFTASLAAEMIISAFNQSMDSWDQAPAATMIEQALCDALCKIYGFGAEADATFTGGGTMSNFMGLLLARDHFSQQNFNWNIQQNGLPPQATKFRILCSEFAHFTVAQSASILGLGQNAVVKISCKNFCEETEALEEKIAQLRAEGLLPIAYVTTAGTTDFGSIGDLGKLADCAQNNGLWFHVDAAYGGALIFSENHKHKLSGIEKADSVTVDFHKLFYQPISCGAFIVKNRSAFNYIRLHADYLNPESNEAHGILDLVYKSIQTTRRFDALKPFLALQHVGVKKLGEMLDYTIALAENISDVIENDPNLELATRTPINAVVFRYLPDNDLKLSNTQIDDINNAIKTELLLSGKAIIGQTCVEDRAFLKFTLLNPMTEQEIVEGLLEEIKAMGARMALSGGEVVK